MILRINEISGFLHDFERYAQHDGTKYFLTLNTLRPNGTLTIMKYPSGKFTYHRKNENYWDIKEIDIELDMLSDIIWGFRNIINEMIVESTIAQ
ncbi:hypothetical protein [Neobacillus drentensis]|uniref:hypothetical protein n=1 Tax=Neobacillus drentensis TaxID=220684 RepID=UPI0030034827